MYHFKESEHATGAVVLDEHIELSGHTIRYLKDFQISAVRFLYERFCKREFSILNDESGLGKTVTTAVLLGIIATKKNCLIVVANKDECITDWRFHLDVLTDLNVKVIDREEDYNEAVPRVYVAKWNTLRVIDDLSKMNFDIIILDNREQMLNNTFCMSTLLKNFEKKVQLVISSVDLTSDVKLMHNILRLGGRLEHQLESFKAFEQKFHLPDLKAISNKKADLEEYFLKREILSDYCRDFRLRRYRHQYEHILPLVDPARYKAHLAHWSETLREKNTPTAININGSVPTEIGTEELLQQYMSQRNHSQEIDEEVQQITRKLITNGEPSIHHSRATPSDGNDEEMNMSPLIYDSESESDADVVEVLSSNSIETVIPVIQIDDGDDESVILVHKNIANESTPAASANANENQCISGNKTCKEREENDNSTKVTINETKKELAGKQVACTKSTRITRSKQSDGRITRSRQSNENTCTRRSLRKDNEISVDNRHATPRSSQIRKLLSAENETPRGKSVKNRKLAVVIKNEKITPKKVSNQKKVFENSNTPHGGTAIKEHDENGSIDLVSAHRAVVKEKEKDENPEESKNTTPNERNASARKISKIISSTCGVPRRETRNMKRITRSTGSKRKCFALEFDGDKKPKIKATPKRSQAVNTMNNDDKQKKDLKFEESPKTSKPKATTDVTPRNSKATRLARKSSPLSTQVSILPPSSDYEEIQCGQKLVSQSSGESNIHGFLMPSTPPSMRNSQFSLLQLQNGKNPIPLLGSESDVVLLSNCNQNAEQPSIFVPSSNDEESLSSQVLTERQTARPLSTKKRKRCSKRTSIKEPLNFGTVLANERNTAKSPDLFSIGSDVGSSNVIPFTQIHCSASTTATNASFGFKIFGSEVRRLQDITPSKDGSPRKSRNGRSCLNILEQMFERKNPTPVPTAALGDNTSNLKVATRKRTTPSVADDKQTSKLLTKTLVTPRKPIHERNQQTHRTELTSDDIFEITNNTTFGSTLRINGSGDISPVQQLNSSQHHNKITNYLIGSGSAKPNNGVDDEQKMFGTPNKRSTTSQQPGSGSTNVRKSPKAIKTTQTTKLTKWFRRSSVEDTIKDNKEGFKDMTAKKTSKRRRLDLSFKS